MNNPVQNNASTQSINWQKDVSLTLGIAAVITLVASGILLGSKYEVCSKLAKFTIEKGLPTNYNTLLSINNIAFGVVSTLTGCLLATGVIIGSNYFLGNKKQIKKDTLQNEVNKLKTEIETLRIGKVEQEKMINDLKTEIETLRIGKVEQEKMINDLKTEIETLQTGKSEQAEEINELKTEKIQTGKIISETIKILTPIVNKKGVVKNNWKELSDLLVELNKIPSETTSFINTSFAPDTSDNSSFIKPTPKDANDSMIDHKN